MLPWWARGGGAAAPQGRGWAGDTSVLTDGVDENIKASDSAFFNVTGSDPFSVEYWFKPAATNNVSIAKRKFGGAHGFAIAHFTDIRFQLYNGAGGLWQKNSGITLTNGVWYHVAITYDGGGTIGGFNFYVNASVTAGTVATNTFTGSAANTGLFAIGSDSNNSSYCNANFAELRLWNRELSGSEMTDLYNGGSLHDVAELAWFDSADLYDEFWMGDGPDDSETQIVGVINGTVLAGNNLEAADLEADVP